MRSSGSEIVVRFLSPILLALAAVCLVPGAVLAFTPSGDLEIHTINVQQGGSTLVIGPDGTRVLLDAGKDGQGSAAVVPYLQSLGIDPADGIHYTVAGHLDSDHIGGMDEVFAAGYDVAIQNWDNGSTKSNTFVDTWRNACAGTTAGAPIPIPVGEVIDLGGGATLTVVAVGGDIIGGGSVPAAQNNENDLSVAVLVEFGSFDFIWASDLGGGDTDNACTGRSTSQTDVETPLAQAITPGGVLPLLSAEGVDVMHVSHHGSESSTNSTWMNLLKPEVATISVGAGQGGNFNHPRIDVVESVLLAQASCVTVPAALVLQTEEGDPAGAETSFAGFPVGDIVITTDGVTDYFVSTTGAVTQGPDETFDAGLPATFPLDEVPTAPQITSTPAITANVGVAYAYAVTASGLPVPTLSATGAAGGPLPGWLAFDAPSGVLSGTPAATDLGTHDVEITAANGLPPDATQAFTITVTSAPPAPVTIASWDFGTDPGTNLAATVAADVTVSGVTTKDGSHSFFNGTSGEAIADNGWDVENYFEFDVTTDPGFETTLSELSFDDQRSGTGPTSWEVFVVVGGVPVAVTGGTGSTHTSFGANAVTFAGADAGPYGAFSIRIVGSSPSSGAGTLRIDNLLLEGTIASTGPPNNPPVADPQSVVTAEDTAVALTLTGSDADEDSLTFSVATGPSNGLLTGTAPNLTYTPNGNFNGTDSFTFTADDGQDTSAPATVSITVDPVNDAPVASDDGATTPEGTAVVVSVLANDSDLDGTLDPATVAVTSGPANGSTSVNLTTGAITYTPNALFSGSDPFTYTVNDNLGATSNAANVAITVLPVNDPPIAFDDGYAVDEDAILSIPAVLGVLDNDSDPDAGPQPLSAVLVSPTANGTLDLQSNGSFDYTPDPDFNGEDSFTYLASDGQDSSASATVTITVNAVNDLPVAAGDAAGTEQDVAVVIDVLANDGDPDGTLDPATVNEATAPANGSTSVNLATGAITYTPAPGFAGPDSFTYTVADDLGGVSNTATVTVTVVAVSSPKLATGTVVSGSDFVTVALPASYTSMVVICTPAYDATSGALVARVDNASGNSFDVAAVTADGANAFVAGVTIHFLAIEEGVYTAAEHGVDAEAVTYLSTVTDEDGDYSAEARSYQQTYTSPVVLGQVMTANDPGWSVFWCQGSSRSAPPTATALRTGKMVGEDPDVTRADETIGYLVIEAGSGTFDGTPFVADLGADIVKGPTNGPPFTYALSGLTAPTAAIATQAAMDGKNGSWAVLFGADAVSATALALMVDEDTAKDTERSHTSEQVAYIVFEGQVNTVPVTADPGPVSTAEDTASATINLTGADAEDPESSLTVDVTAGPTTGSLSATSGSAPLSVTYTPDPDFNGADSFAFTVTDLDLGVSTPRIVNITVTAVNDTPVADDQPVATAEDTPLAITLTANDADAGDTLTFTVGNPLHGTLSGTAPDLTYTPAADYNGPDSIAFSVNDGTENSNVATVSITVTAVNDPPVADDQPSVATSEDASIAITLTATDVENDTLTFAVVTGPSNGSLSGSAPNLTYTPGADFNGADSFTFTANDGAADSNLATVSITVTAVNDVPVADDQSVATAEDTPLAITLTANDADAGDTLTFTVGNPLHGTLSGTAPDLTYTPAADYNGPDSIAFSVNDGTENSSVATVSITVTAVNDPPVADDQPAVVTAEDTAVAITLIASDPENDPLTFAVVTGPSNGSLSGSAPNLTYTPGADFNGADSFTFTANDGVADSNLATVSIAVSAVNDAPVADDQSVATAEDTPLAITLTASDADTGDTLTFAVVALPANGQLTGTAPNLTYTPEPGFTGLDSFTFEANDGTVDSNVATVSIDVTAVNDPPVADDQPTVVTAEDTAVAITLIASDPENDLLTFAVVTGPVNGTLSGTAPNLTYTPNADFNGADSFTFTANDGAADSNLATVSITVTAVNDAPTATITAPADDASLSGAVAFAGSASDIEDGDLTADLAWTSSLDGAIGTGGSFTATLSVGSHTITASVTDSGGTSGSDQIILTVAEVSSQQLTFESLAAEDGWVRESNETSDEGKSTKDDDDGDDALRIGDDNKDKQYKTILSFDTSALPAGAVVESATLVLTRGSIRGTNPFTTHGSCVVDVKSGSFNGDPSLEKQDFQAPADATAVAALTDTPTVSVELQAGLSSVNVGGRTQLRVYFQLDDDDDRDHDYVGFFSGEASDSALRPSLVVTFSTP